MGSFRYSNFMFFVYSIEICVHFFVVILIEHKSNWYISNLSDIFTSGLLIKATEGSTFWQVCWFHFWFATMRSWCFEMMWLIEIFIQVCYSWQIQTYNQQWILFECVMTL